MSNDNHLGLVRTADRFDDRTATENVAKYLEQEFLLTRVKSRKEIDDNSFVATSGGGVSVFCSLGNRAMVCKAISMFKRKYDGEYGLKGGDPYDYSVWQVRPSTVRRRQETGPGFGKGVWRVNAERHQIDVSLDKCDTERRSKLKEMGFRWWKTGGFWYNRDAPALRTFVEGLGLVKKDVA